jgi:C4-dicarboxylate-specific signal transduction histidine kinase
MQRIHPDDIRVARRWIEPANGGEPEDALDIRLVMPDGSIKYVHAVSHAVCADASARRALRALIDVTAAREADAALRHAQSELEHASRMTALGELTTSIAHEVNQPLAAIVTNGQACLRWLGRDVPDLDEARGAVTRIIADADRASEVIRRIRALGRKSDTKRARLNLNDVIDEVTLLVRHEVSSHRISLRRELASGLPPVLGDQVQLEQVLINLVINAIQAMATVMDRPRELLIRSGMQEPDQLVVAVRDSGIGIAPEKLSQVFDTFFTTKADGMGMGLSICRSIIEAHGGQVWASSNDGPGVTFQFTLPSIQPSSP